jgi:hypothetical protein
MPQSSTWFRSLLATSALCAVGAAWAPQALAQSQANSCTLRAPLELFSKPRGQGRRTHLGTGAVVEILSHNGNWYTVHTGNAEAYAAASAFSRSCPPQSRSSAPRPKAATDLIDIPLEPLPTAPSSPQNPLPALPTVPELKDSNTDPAVPPPAPQVAPELAPAPPKRLEAPPPASYFEPPAPLLGQRVSPDPAWVGLETGLWIGGGVVVVTSVVLFTVNAIRASTATTDINAYTAAANNNASIADQTALHAKAAGEADTVHTLNTWTVVTGVVGGAALATALGLHYWGPQAFDGSSEASPMAMPSLHIGWGSFVLEGKF